MDHPNTLTLKIINDQTVLDSFSKGRDLTEHQKELIRFVAKAAVEEYILQTKTWLRTQDPDCVLKMREVKILTGLSSSTIYLGIKSGTFPQPIKLGKRAVGWKESQITTWIKERQAKK